jgi:hypothetical protein
MPYSSEDLMIHTLIYATKRLACLSALAASLPGFAIESVPVRITNPATAPVPVTGAVGVTGPVSVTGNVGVTGTVGISGTPTVNIQSLPPVSINPATPIKVNVKASDTSSLFSVPLFIEQNFATPTLSVLGVQLNLTAPAVLENVSADCGGIVTALRVYVDGGPNGVNGTTGSADSTVGLVVGTLAPLPIGIPYLFFPTVTPDGFGTLLPVSTIGAPVSSGVQVILYPDTTKSSPQCFMNLVFRAIN